jgi:energy-coupling factor transport system ATP-binding protein
VIHLDRLTYTYPLASRPVLRDVTLDVDAGEFVLVTGRSGAGKSTLLRCFNGLVPHFTGGRIGGRARVAGHDPVAEGPQALSRAVGFVFQDPEAQFVVDRVEDEVAFALENQALPREEMRRRVEDVLGRMDLLPLRGRSPDTLSGGEKQRVAIAAALVLRPRVLVLDEPTSQLDPRAAGEVLQSLVRLNRELDLTVVLAEHRLERVLPYADRLVHLTAPGEPVLSGPPRAVLRRMELTPPLVTLGKRLGWDPLPLTIEEGRRFVDESLKREPEPVSQDRPSSAPCPPASLLRVEALSFHYNGADVLREVDVCVRGGELLALMGPNGAGKTTLLKAIVGLLRSQQGQVYLAGAPLAGRPTADICREVGYLPQNSDDLLFADTVAAELEVTLRNHGLQGDPPRPPGELLERLGLAHLADAYPRDLSVGQRQRVALGAIGITRPRLLLLDEPTRGMDYPAKEALIELLREELGQGVGVLLVTHDVELVARAADRVAILEEGRIVADGPARTVLNHSPLFTPQIARLFPATGWLTVEQALERENILR